ncbi:hypothetical protein MTO96_029227 [Rhipicephalus appendiculatus]
MVSAHPQGRPRCAVYVRRELPHAHINVADVTGGALECCAVMVRLRGVDTTVASVYVRPGQRWSATELLKLTARLGRSFALPGHLPRAYQKWEVREAACFSELRFIALGDVVDAAIWEKPGEARDSVRSRCAWRAWSVVGLLR